MRVDYAFVAEAADSQNGVFSVTRGGTDLFYMPSMPDRPIIIPAVSFVIRLVGEPHEIGVPQPVTYTIVDEDGRPIGYQQDGQIEFGTHPVDPTRTTAVISAIRFYGLPLPSYGTYLFEVRAGDERLAQVPIWVAPMITEAEGPKLL